MSDLLGISSTAVMAYQRALGTTSNNIANVHTEGYVRQETDLAEGTPRKVANVYLGTGVRFAGIKRAYDEFLENNVRTSSSDLNTQQPMVDYANRIIDLMGSETVGLPPALDKFFATAQQLSTDPASRVLRAQFLRDADGLAGRFGELSSQLTSVDSETREATNKTIDEINTLSKQIALLNKQLSAEVRVERQSPELLDQRDRLLKELSKLVKLNVITADNGAVNISLTTNAKLGLIVDGQKSIELGAKFDETDLGRVAIIADPYGEEPQTVPGISNGKLGGLLIFREQLLQPTMAQLDSLAKSMVEQVNTIHTNAIDLEGKVGVDLFKIDPVTVIDKVSGEAMTIDRAAAGIKLAIDDPLRVAAGALFRVIENDKNLSNVDATLTYAANYADPKTVPSIANVIKNNADPSAGVNAPQGKLLGQIPLGSNNWSLYLDGASGNQQLQVFTRDGRQLIGAPLTDDTEAQLLVNERNGFFKGSTYSTQYLNKSGIDGYKQAEVFYGLMARPIEHYGPETQFTPEHDVLPSVRTWVENYGETIDDSLVSIPANTLTINGKVLPQLLPTPPARTIQASDIANWMNRATNGMIPTVAVNALTTVSLEVADATAGMYVNGVSVPADATRDINGLATYINQSIGSLANVEATIKDGKLVLTNAIGYGGRDITVGTMDADGKIADEHIYKGKLNFSQDGTVTIGYGPDGVLGDMDKLGKPIGTYFTAIKPRVYTSALIKGVPIPSNVDSITGEAITINGKSLGPLDLGRTLQASDMAQWINEVSDKLDPPVTATGSTDIKVGRAQYRDKLATGTLKINGVSIQGTGPAGSFASADDLAAAINGADTGKVMTTTDKLDLTRALKINGVTINGSNADGSFAPGDDLVALINAHSAETGVTASQYQRADLSAGVMAIDLKHKIGGDIVLGPPGLRNALGVTDGTYSKVRAEVANDGTLTISNQSGADIVIGSVAGGNVLGIGNGPYKGVLSLESKEEVRVGFGETGDPAELAKLGMRTGVYLDGPAPEDLLVFVTGDGAGTVAGSYDESMKDPAALTEARINSLRAQKFDVTFTSNNHYQITWKNPTSGIVTIVAERDYDAKQGIEYQGLKFTLNKDPLTGDTFRLDGNQDGTGNNQAILDMVALKTKKVIGGAGGSTIAESYEETVGKVGNFSNQATIAQKALQVVNDQAVAARDKVSGVSLDSEAADLIRYQQAYQASAKAMQVANTLFDSILDIR